VRWRFAVVGAALGVAAVAVACGGGNDDAGETVDPSPGTATASAPRETAAADDPIAAFEGVEVPLELVDGDAIGDADAPVTLTLYEDFQCPFCLAFNLAYEEVLLTEYVEAGMVRLEFRHYPILGPESEQAALATICAADQDVFWPMHNRLFLEQAKAGQLTQERLNVGRFSLANLRGYAEEAGADIVAWDACLEAPTTRQRMQADVREARALGLPGTPGVVLNGTPVAIPRDVAELRALLDSAIEEAP
jgi:protein-disulfide isomerase